jgi:hypothetical protein
MQENQTASHNINDKSKITSDMCETSPNSEENIVRKISIPNEIAKADDNSQIATDLDITSSVVISSANILKFEHPLIPTSMNTGLWANIFLFLNLKNVVSFRNVNKKWNRMIDPYFHFYEVWAKAEITRIPFTLDKVTEGFWRTELGEDLNKNLSLILSSIEEAKKNLQNLINKDIAEVKSYNNPPRIAIKTGELVLTLLGERDLSWPSFKKTLSDVQFIQKLLYLDFTELKPPCIKKLNIIWGTEPFDLDAFKRVSQCCYDLAVYTLRMKSAWEEYQKLSLEYPLLKYRPDLVKRKPLLKYNIALIIMYGPTKSDGISIKD